jgi:predicted hydrocarbon binding protein
MTVPSFHYPNHMGRIMLESMEEVMGRNGLQDVLALADRKQLASNYPPANLEREFSFETVSALQATLEQAYGSRSGRGLAQRVGRVCFKYGLRDFGDSLGLTETAFRLLPMRSKLRTAGRALADLFNKLLWQIERCPLCWGRHADEAVCHLAVGLLQESLYWLSSGKMFRVEETHCTARGDSTCTIEIHSTPLD